MTRITYMLGTTRRVAVIRRDQIPGWLREHGHVTILRVVSAD